MHIGNILKNTADGSVLGAVVHTYPNKLIIFRNVNGLNPGIFKMPIEDLNNPMIASVGTINQPEFEPIKKALLKYYRRETLPESEKAVFSRIMEYAFPNGVPLFDDLAERMPDDATRAIRLADHLQPGKCLYINTVQTGPFGHLDNQCVYVLGGDEFGIWVCPHQSGSEFNTSYLPFKDRSVPKFWSVNRLLPGQVHDNRGAEYVGRFLAAKTQGGLANQITHADTRIKLAHDPETGRATVIMPQKWAGQNYDFPTGTIKPITNTTQSKAYKIMGLGSSDIINDNEPYIGGPTPSNIQQTDDTTKLGGKDDLEHTKLAAATLAELNADQLAFQDKIERTGQSILKSIKKQQQQTGGGAAADIADAWAGVDTIEPIIPDDLGANQASYANLTNNAGRRRRLSSAEAEDLAAVAELGSTPLASEDEDETVVGSDNGDEMVFNEADLEFLEDDEPIIELEKVQKIRQMPVPDLEKVFKESIQKGHIYKQKLEKIPALLRDNPLYKDRIAKDVNVISLLKAQMTTESRMVIARPADYHPMIETMLRNDYTNHFLVPLIVSTKKLYLTKKDPITRDDLAGPTASVEPDFHKYMSEWCKQNAKGGIKKMVDINENLNRIMTESAPHLPATTSTLGLMVRFGEGIRPGDTRNRDTTVKLKTTRAQEEIEYLAQATQAIRFGSGGREFQLRNFAVDTQPFDSHVVLGPIGNYSNIPKTEYTIAEIEAMEEEVDKNIATVGSVYNISYMGDNVNLVGFVRPPVMNFLQGRGENLPSLASELSTAEDKGQIVIRYLDSEHPDSFEDRQNESLDDPDKFIVYLFQDPGTSTNSGPTLTDDVLRVYLGRIVPRFNDITKLFTDTYRVEQPGDMERLIEILYKFDYIVPHREGLSLAASRTQPETHLRLKTDANWENTQALMEVEDRIVRAMVAYNNKMDKIHRLRVMRDAKHQERDELSKDKSSTKDNQHQLITSGLIELADKIYGERYTDIAGTGEHASLDENKLDYYAHKTDRAQYINLLLRKTSLSRLQELLSIPELESSLAVLKSKYEASGRALPNDLTSRVAPETLEKTQLGKCAAADGQGGIGGRKPRILRYPSLARMKEDNAKVATTPAGDLVLEGDYAMVEEAGKKLIFRRETLNDGDFWIGQPISVLEQLLFKKRATCAATGDSSANKIPTQAELDTARAAMRLPEEQLTGTDSDPDKTKNLQLGKDGQPTSECIFDVSRLQCLPVDIVDMDRDLADIQARIMDVNGQLAFARALPPLLAECEKSLAAAEKEIRNYNHGVVLVEKYYTALVAQQQKELEALVKRRRDCPHFAVVQYLEGLLNLSDQERYMLVKEIINRFQNQEQASRLDLLEVAPDSKNNNIECHICSQTLLCKHYLYALELIENSENGRLDDKALQTAYGEVLGGTYYCRGCGAPLGNTEVLDIEEFEKDGGKEGVHVKTREVMEDIGVIERQKAAVDKIITAAINDNTDDDMKTKLRIYKLAKDLLGLAVMSVEDELAIVNFLKTYEFIPRQTFYNLIYRRFLQAQGGRANAINKAAVDTKANEFFWQHATCDILGHLLIIIQTSVQTYTVFNKLCATNNYMGWPLLSVGSGGDIPEEDQGGIELMYCVIKQIAVLPEFHMLGGSDTSGLRNQLVKRITEQIRNNEMVRTRLDRALDTKYNQISLLEEFRLSSTNYWPSYRPVMAGTIPGGVKWTPIRDLDMAAVQDWSAKAHSAMISAGRDNIAYQSQVLTHNLTSVIEKEAPANRIMLVNTVANSCCPIDYSVLMKSGIPEDRASNDAIANTPGKTHTQSVNKSKYLNPEINYYMNLERENEPIRNALRRIGEYAAMIKILERSVAPARVRLTFPYVSKDIIPKDMTLALEGAELQAFFLKFIDEGPFKGAEHIFDPFGRCIVSGALKRDVAAISYTQTDFDRLLSVVERQKVIKDPRHTQQNRPSGALGLPFGSSHILIQLVAAIEKNPTTASGKYINLEQLVEMAPRVNELLEHNTRFVLDLENLTKDFILLARLTNECNNPKICEKISKRLGHLKVIIGQMEKLTVARLNELMLANIGWGFREFGVGAKQTNRVNQQMGGATAAIKGAKSGLIQDYKKEYYGLITMIDTERQSEISAIVDVIGTNKKAELGLEQTLINLGALRDIGRDLRELMDQQERIVPHYEYVNHDREQEIQHYIIRADFIRKLLCDVRLLVVQLKNEAWMDFKTAADVPDYLREFYKYKDAALVFRDKLVDIVRLLTSLGGLLDGITEGSIFGAEVVAGLLSYIFPLMLGGMISRVADDQPHANQAITIEVPTVIPHDDHPVSIAITNSENEFDFVAAMDRAKGRVEPNAAKQGAEHLVIQTTERLEILDNQDETTTNAEEEELGLYPEFVAEPTPNDPISAHDEYSNATELNLGAAAKEVKTTQRRVVIDFVRDVVLFAQRMEHIYNEMNLDRIREQMARTQEKQTKLNLAAPKFLKQEGMEDDYRLVMNLINLGFMEYKDLYAYTRDHYGDDVFRQGEEEIDARPQFDGGDDYEGGDGPDRDEEARRNKYGVDDAEMAEMGYVGAQEDMEEMDYGYMGVDEA
jgi:hypothetical protein